MNCLFAKNIKRQPSAFFLFPSADAHDADDVESSGKQQGLVCIHNQNNICIFLTVYILKLKASDVYVCYVHPRCRNTGSDTVNPHSVSSH